MSAHPFTLPDHKFMARAITLARKGNYTTSPNPNVGCVIVKDGIVIGEGFHQKAGEGHAEVNALANLAVEESKGATAYVTLEPCSHYGRTPPCAKRLIDAKVKQVVIAMLDPNPLVSGRGVSLLEDAGIKVLTGLLEQDARGLNRGFLSRMEKSRPFIQVKLAASLDGKTALRNGESQWITGPSARAEVQEYRAASCAILTTASTVLRDNARLNVRCEQLNSPYPLQQYGGKVRQPIKIVLDSQNRLTGDMVDSLALFNDNAKVIVVRKEQGVEFKDKPNVSSYVAPYIAGHGFDLDKIAQWCGEIEINNLWVEAGGQLAASLIESGTFDQLIVYYAPKILGQGAQDMLPIGPFNAMSEVAKLTVVTQSMVGDDIKLILQKV